MQGQGVLIRAARLGTSVVTKLARPAPCITSVRTMGMFDEKERGEETVHFRREEERLLRQLLSKVKAQADAVDKTGADGAKNAEIAKLKAMLPKHKLTDKECELLLGWKHGQAD